MLLECLWAPFSFCLRIVAKLLCWCLCLFDATIEFDAMDEETSNDFLIGKLDITRFCFTFIIFITYIVEAFITLN